MGRKKASAVPPILTAALRARFFAVSRASLSWRVSEPFYACLLATCSSLSLRLLRSACVRFYWESFLRVFLCCRALACPPFFRLLSVVFHPAAPCRPLTIGGSLWCAKPGILLRSMHLMFVLYLYSLYLYHNKKQKSSVFCCKSQYFFIFVLNKYNFLLLINPLRAPAKCVKLELGLIRPGYTRAWACKDDCGKSALYLHAFCLHVRKKILKWNKRKNSLFLKWKTTQ